MCGDGANDCGVSEIFLEYILKMKNWCNARRIFQTEHMLEMRVYHFFTEQLYYHQYWFKPDPTVWSLPCKGCPRQGYLQFVISKTCSFSLQKPPEDSPGGSKQRTQTSCRKNGNKQVLKRRQSQTCLLQQVVDACGVCGKWTFPCSHLHSFPGLGIPLEEPSGWSTPREWRGTAVTEHML